MYKAIIGFALVACGLYCCQHGSYSPEEKLCHNETVLASTGQEQCLAEFERMQEGCPVSYERTVECISSLDELTSFGVRTCLVNCENETATNNWRAENGYDN